MFSFQLSFSLLFALSRKELKIYIFIAQFPHHVTFLAKRSIPLVLTNSIRAIVCLTEKASTHASVTYRSEKAMHVEEEPSFVRPLKDNVFSYHLYA